MELDLRILGRDLHMARFGMIQEEPRDLLERIRRKAGLNLADNATKLLLPGEYADLGLKRLDELALDESALFRLAAIERTATLPVPVERLAGSGIALEGMVSRRLRSVKTTRRTSFAGSTLFVLLIAESSAPGFRDNLVASRPRRRKVKRAESA